MSFHYKMKMLFHYLLFSVIFIQSVHSLSIPSETDSANLIPKIKFQDLQSILNGQGNYSSFDLDRLQDAGRNWGILEISNLGPEYKDALNTLQNDAPKCIGNTTNRIPRKIEMPDGSYRKTYATTSKTYPGCISMDILSQTFDEIDLAIMRLLNEFSEHNFDEPNLECSQLSYNMVDTNVRMENALEKEHIHVYTKNEEQSGKTFKHETSKEDLVPFHVDNGLFLIITPVPAHGMNVKLSNGVTASTDHVGLDSALVLIGRGLTEWLLSTKISHKRRFYAVPHSVPTLIGSGLETRTVYARMNVPPPSATTGMADCVDYNGNNINFQEFFRAG